jgi:hypothetical protein
MRDNLVPEDRVGDGHLVLEHRQLRVHLFQLPAEPPDKIYQSHHALVEGRDPRIQS